VEELVVGLGRLEAKVVLEDDEAELVGAHRLLARLVEAAPRRVHRLGREVAARDALLRRDAVERKRAHAVQLSDESGQGCVLDGLIGE
jgi:hypothetical protein